MCCKAKHDHFVGFCGIAQKYIYFLVDMLLDIDLILARPKGPNNPYAYYPEQYEQNSSQSIIAANYKYDLTRFSQHEADVVRKVLSIVKTKYPAEFQSLGLVNEAYVIKYKPRYVLFEIAVTKYRNSASAFDKFAVAYAFANKGADFRLAAIGAFEEAIGKIPFTVLDKFASLDFTFTCNMFSKLYEQEWEFDNAIFWLKKAIRRGGLNSKYFAERINKIKKRKIDVIRNNKHKRNRRISIENEKFEHDVHAAALRFIQE